MSLILHNTLTGKKDEFKPLNRELVRMYNCGPTVYDYAHIGNLRAYLFADTVRRALEWDGYRVRQVVNITDVGHLTSDADEGDDKMVKALKRLGKPMTLEAMKEVADFYEKAFREDIRALNILYPHEMPRASEHIAEDIALIQILLEKEAAYRRKGGIYFDVSRFPSYGKLGNIDLRGLRAGARVSANPEKKNARDFALWKFSDGPAEAGSGRPVALGWDSPFGRGYPGWHIECSAMSRKYLGQPFDIHTGGIDHIPTHHQNEIAQSETAYGTPLANYWLHNEHLIISSGKMAKSEKNFVTLRTLADKNINPLAYRYLVLTVHYRSPINFSFDALRAAQNSYVKLLLAFGELKGNGAISKEYTVRFEKGINDDFHTPSGIAALWDLLKDGTVSDADKRATLLDFDAVLGLDILHQWTVLKEEMESVPGDVKMLAQEREEARRAKDFTGADSIRSRIQAAGFEVMDTDSGPLIRKKMSI